MSALPETYDPPTIVDALLGGAPPEEADALFPHGALALCLTGPRGPAGAAVAETFPQAHRAAHPDRVLALVPLPWASGDATGPVLAAARRLVRRHPAAAGVSAPEPVAARLGRALREAELVARLVGGGTATTDEASRGTWWLLVRTALRAPGDLATLVDGTLGPLRDVERGPASELLPTFAAYLANGCNMNATSAAMPAHRHTVAHRLERLRDVTGLDPLVPEDREQLGVAL
jgi:hypothetical protein